jgi:hypothetical protein
MREARPNKINLKIGVITAPTCVIFELASTTHVYLFQLIFLSPCFVMLTV